MWVTLYTDASWEPEEGVGGWGIWARCEKGRLTDHGKCPKWVDCNNSAEIAAIVIGVFRVFEEWDDVEGILVCTDSTTAMQYLKFRPNGTKSLKRKKWLKVRRIVHDLLDLKDCKIKIRHVKGHQSSKTVQGWLNNKVDHFSRKYGNGNSDK